jgi:hypothetical protein
MLQLDWFETDYDYSGMGEVVFDEPHAEFSGPASVKPDQNGRPLVEITIQHANPLIEDGFDLAAIQLGAKTLPDGTRMIGLGGGIRNRAHLAVNGNEWRFSCGPTWDYKFSDWSEVTPVLIRFTPSISEFAPSRKNPEKFLILPLIGFDLELPVSHPASAIRNHPLSLCPNCNHSSARSVAFEVNGELAFVQQFHDVHGEGVTLRPWSGETVLTALAVVPISDTSMADPWGHFINLFLGLLDLAGGKEVTVPWVEVRGVDGSLVRRLHLTYGDAKTTNEGYRVLDGCNAWHLGHLLTCGLNSPDAREPYFPIALKHCHKAGLPGLTLEDELSRIVRALECISKQFGLNKQDLSDGLPTLVKSGIDTALSAVGDEIRRIANTTADPIRTQVLRIAERARSASQIDRSFGLAVVALASRFGLQDAEVLEPYYKYHPGPGGRNWIETLSYYRGAVFHEGYVDFDSNLKSFGEVLGFILHLHDLLTRILLRIVGYGGTYQPRSIRARAASGPDWVRPGINVDALLNIPTLNMK